MSTGSLSEKDRVRMAELIRAPLTGPPRPLKPPKSFAWGRVMSALRIGQAHLAIHWRWWAAGAGTVVLCAALLSLAGTPRTQLASDSIRLQALDREGQLLIQWDPDSFAIRRATAAKLYIVDGDERIFVNLNTSRLGLGTVSYARRSDRVDLRMTLSEPDGKLFEERVNFLGAAPHPQPPSTPQLEARAESVKPEPTFMTPTVSSAPPVTARPGTLEHRARSKTAVSSGAQLPFTCSTGDVFRKTDAPAGWDTFSCRARNVWSLIRDQGRGDRSNNKPAPNATTLIAKPAAASTM